MCLTHEFSRIKSMEAIKAICLRYIFFNDFCEINFFE
jgi:hypothetical protein